MRRVGRKTYCNLAVSIGLMSRELLQALLDDVGLVQGSRVSHLGQQIRSINSPRYGQMGNCRRTREKISRKKYSAGNPASKRPK